MKKFALNYYWYINFVAEKEFSIFKIYMFQGKQFNKTDTFRTIYIFRKTKKNKTDFCFFSDVQTHLQNGCNFCCNYFGDAKTLLLRVFEKRN